MNRMTWEHSQRIYETMRTWLQEHPEIKITLTEVPPPVVADTPIGSNWLVIDDFSMIVDKPKDHP